MENFKKLFEGFGPLGGDQRNMRCSQKVVNDWEKFDGKKIEFKFQGYVGDDPDDLDRLKSMARSFNVDIENASFDDFEVIGKKNDIIKFLKNMGYKSREYREYFWL